MVEATKVSTAPHIIQCSETAKSEKEKGNSKVSVNSHLEKVSSDLVLSESENVSITGSIDALADRLKGHFNHDIEGHFKFGSSTRGTILPRKADNNSDIDYMIVFNTSDGEKKPQTYIDRLKRFAEAKYTRSEIYQSSPTVVLSLNHINFELVPAVSQFWSGYKIPSPASSWGEWMDTNPNGINAALQEKNKNNNYRIKPLIRLIKYWNARNGYCFPSFDLETKIINMGFYYFFTTSLRDYFYSFWSQIDYTWDTAQYIKDKVLAAKEHVKKAKEYENEDRQDLAESEITKVVPQL